MTVLKVFFTKILRILRPSREVPAMAHPFNTIVSPCDLFAIAFPEGSDQPEISSESTLNALKDASHRLVKELACVAFPTETVYGLGALALDADAASRIFSTKGRPADNPLIVHVSSFAMLHRLLPSGYVMPKTYEILTQRFWPGPLTLLFPSDRAVIPSIITAGQPTVAIRMPSHPVARALIAIADAPLAAPSANSSGKPSPTRAEHVQRDLNGKVGLVLDGGPCDVGLESTVVDGLHDDGHIRVLRPGGVTVEAIERALVDGLGDEGQALKVLVHKRDYRDDAVEQAPTTPGMKYRHYSPSIPVTLLVTSGTPPPDVIPVSVEDWVSSLQSHSDPSQRLKVGLLAPSDSPVARRLLAMDIVDWISHPLGPVTEPSISAQRLFDGFLTLEREGADLIVMEELEEKNEGLAIMNRARKADNTTVWVVHA